MSAGPSGRSRTTAIRSFDNRIVKLVRSLRRRSVREAERAFVVEGKRAVADALLAGAVPRVVLLRADDADQEPDLRRLGDAADVRLVESMLFNDLADTVTPQGVLAVFEQPSLSVDLAGNPFVLIVDQLRDPGNVGTLLRTAAAAGGSLVVFTPETVDPYNPKVVRAAMGSHFRVPIRRWTDDVRRAIEQSCPNRLVAAADAVTPYDAVDWRSGTALVVGSEAHGVSPELAALATGWVSIPLSANVESLNAAVAGAVLLFEAARQRRHSTSHGRLMHPGRLAKT